MKGLSDFWDILLRLEGDREKNETTAENSVTAATVGGANAATPSSSSRSSSTKKREKDVEMKDTQATIDDEKPITTLEQPELQNNFSIVTPTHYILCKFLDSEKNY